MANYKMRIDYDATVRQANKLSNVAEELNEAKRKLAQAKSAAEANWDSPAARIFKQKLDGLSASLESASGEASRLEQDIKTIAKRIKREDEELARKAAALEG